MAPTVLITGAAGGIGLATTRRLTDLGWEVFAGVRQAADADRVPAGVQAVTLDITDRESLATAAKQLSELTRDHGLDGLVNNAGLIVQGPVEAVPIEAWRRQFEVNVLGQVAVTQAVLPLLRTARGRVVNIGAVSGSTPVPFLGPIGASKAALASLTDALRMELRQQGIYVSLVEPGALDTEIFRKADAYAGTGEYAEAVARMQAAFEKQAPGPVDHAVTAIVKALTSRRPARRYLVGRDARMLAMLRKLPAGPRERLLLRALGVA